MTEIILSEKPLIRLIHGDCMEFMAGCNDEIIDITITSPPYNLGAKHHTGSNTFNAYDEYIDDIPEDEYQEMQVSVMSEIYRITKQGGSLFYNHKNRIKNGVQISPYEWILKTDWVIKQEIVWFNGSQNFDKCRFYPMTERIYWLSKGVETGFINNANSHDLFKDEAVGVKGEHKRAFPEGIVLKILKCFPNSNVVFDPYTGSGTTALVAAKINKTSIGCEISKDYFDAAVKRVKRFISEPKIQFPSADEAKQSKLF